MYFRSKKTPARNKMSKMKDFQCVNVSWRISRTISYLWYQKHESESEVTQSCPTLCDPMDCSLPGFSVHGIFQARLLEWVAISFSRRSLWPRNWTRVSCIVGRCSTVWATRDVKIKRKSNPTERSKGNFYSKALFQVFMSCILLTSVKCDIDHESED